MLGLVVAMGIGRFAFTPILPLMQRDLAMSNTVAGWLAGLNYLGYLAGAVLCSISPQVLHSRFVTGSALLLSLVTTLFMGLTVSPFWWGTMRLVGGWASAILFIVISAEVGEALTRRGYGHWVGALYAGVGFGIAISGLIVPQLDLIGGWSLSWIGMGVIATVLAAFGILLGRRRDLVQPVTINKSEHSGSLRVVRLLAVAYFFEGLGYIVTATFIVAIITITPGLESFAPYSWVAVGLAAVPSTLFWPYLARRIGSQRALLSAYALQAAGILVSIHADTVFEVVFAAISFGGTFLGIGGRGPRCRVSDCKLWCWSGAWPCPCRYPGGPAAGFCLTINAGSCLCHPGWNFYCFGQAFSGGSVMTPLQKLYAIALNPCST
jgi:MFS family permease